MRKTLLLSLALSGCTWIYGRIERVEMHSALPICNTTATGSYQSGAGTSSDPYIICSLNQWKVLAATSSDWSKHFKLQANLDFTGLTTSTFPFVGTSGARFTGSLDGGGYKMSNLTLSSGSSQYLAIFPYTDGSVSFSNLTIENVTLTTAGSLGALVADHASGTLGISNLTSNSE